MRRRICAFWSARHCPASGRPFAGWWQRHKGHSAVLVVGHQPTLGQSAALLLSDEEACWSIKKGAVWWFSNRTRQGESQTVLRAVIPPDFWH